MSQFYPYQNRAVRDLAWTCFSPALLHTARLHPTQGFVADANFELTPARQRWLEQLERDALPLLEYLDVRNTTRLGLYFERLWQFFLREDPEVELVAHNLPVADGGRTLGEFDCIYYCHRRNVHVHLELAVKFYLGVPGEPGETAWWGPNTQDRLDLKLAHLLERQVTLGARPAAQRQLNRLGIGTVEREIALRGYLFQPPAEPLPAPAGYNAQLPFASWCHQAQLVTQIAVTAAPQFRLLDRLEWLAGQRAEPQECIAGAALAAAIRDRFSTHPAPVLVAALDAAAEERGRFFVVPTGWPDNCATDTGKTQG
ncbi:MAG: DUF1853 family protein [Halioglobus sp.]|nr:DUF1853 family protein [Halioglobus sp.]